MALINPIAPYQMTEMRETIGIVSGTATVTKFPDAPAQMVMFQSYDSNISKMYVGQSGTSCLWEINTDEETPWIFVKGGNLGNLWYKGGTGTVDKLVYWVQY